MTKMGHKVFVGMSGGVDSSVSAALLKKAGFDVTGVFIRVWQPDWIECNWKEERLEAMRAAAHLDIPFVTLDLEKEYKKEVIDHMIDEYRAGRTPNPDVMCNRYVKFGAFSTWAKQNGADFIATGHYAINKEEGGKYSLYAGKDKEKDQSYFLWTLGQEDLKHILFPVGEYTKADVRKMALKFKLPNAMKKDSQGLCFIGKVDVKEFLSKYIEQQKGYVLDEKGNVIGEHPGAAFFTIGERHGFSLSKNTPDGSPLYVVSKDIDANTITVSPNQPFASADSKAKNICRLIKINWISGNPPHDKDLKARARYRAPLESIELDRESVAFNGDSKAQILASGQSVVLYLGDKCLGGGVIE